MNAQEKALRQFGAAAGFVSLCRVARHAQLSRQALFHAVRGERTPRRASIVRLAKVLHVSPEILEDLFASARSTSKGAA